MRKRGNLPDGRRPKKKKKKTKMSPMDAATYNALALLLLLFPPSPPFTQQRRWRSAPLTKESGSGSNFSNSWRFGAPWAPHAQKQFLDFKITQNEHFFFKKRNNSWIWKSPKNWRFIQKHSLKTNIRGFHNHPKRRYHQNNPQQTPRFLQNHPQNDNSTKSENPRQTPGFQNHPKLKIWKKGRQEENPK